MSKKSENSSEPRTKQDGMNEYVETAGEVKDNEVGIHKPENSFGQDEKNKSIEGKEEMEWLDHSEVQSQKHASFGKGLLLCDYQVDMFFFGVDDNKSAASCALSGLMQVDCQEFVSTSLMQVVSTTYSKSANIRLHQV